MIVIHIDFMMQSKLTHANGLCYYNKTIKVVLHQNIHQYADSIVWNSIWKLSFTCIISAIIAIFVLFWICIRIHYQYFRMFAQCLFAISNMATINIFSHGLFFFGYNVISKGHFFVVVVFAFDNGNTCG